MNVNVCVVVFDVSLIDQLKMAQDTICHVAKAPPNQ